MDLISICYRFDISRANGSCLRIVIHSRFDRWGQTEERQYLDLRSVSQHDG